MLATINSMVALSSGAPGGAQHGALAHGFKVWPSGRFVNSPAPFLTAAGRAIIPGSGGT